MTKKSTGLKVEKSIFRKFTSFCFSIFKFLLLPEVMIWAIICAINYKICPPRRIWYAVRMAHFTSGSRFTNLLIRISFFVSKFTYFPLSLSNSNVFKRHSQPIKLSNPIHLEDLNNFQLNLNSQGYLHLGYLKPELLNTVSRAFDSQNFFEDIEPQFHFEAVYNSKKNTGRFFADPLLLSKNSVFQSLYQYTMLSDILYKYFKIRPLLTQCHEICFY